MSKRCQLPVGHLALVLVSIILGSAFLLVACLEAIKSAALTAATMIDAKNSERLYSLASMAQMAIVLCVAVSAALVASVLWVLNTRIRGRLLQLKALVQSMGQAELRIAALRQFACGNDEFGEIGRELLLYNQRVVRTFAAKSGERDTEAPTAKSATVAPTFSGQSPLTNLH